LLAEYDVNEAADEDLALMFFATVGTFNQKSKDKGALLLFKSDLDTKEEATWEALKRRETGDGIRRPLPAALARILTSLKKRGWTEETLTTQVSSRDVADSGLVKRDVVMGGYTIRDGDDH